MKIDIVDIDKLVVLNNLPQVTSTILTGKAVEPEPNGIYSFEIFGRTGDESRKFQFAYIDLKHKFLHPVVYKIIERSETKLVDVINGTRDVSLDASGNIIDDPNGTTGLQFLYDNWDKISWRENESRERGQKMDLIKLLARNEAFCSKWLVIPPLM